MARLFVEHEGTDDIDRKDQERHRVDGLDNVDRISRFERVVLVVAASILLLLGLDRCQQGQTIKGKIMREWFVGMKRERYDYDGGFLVVLAVTYVGCR